MSLEGQHLGEYEILERLGQGGMGAVYKARQTSLDRFVALKTLQAALAGDAEYIARFRQEAKAAAVLSHPNLVQVFSAGESEGLHWFAMEYIEGESAKVRLNRKGRLDPLEAIAIGSHVATALEYGWRKAKLIHRDIKPDNIFLSSEGEVKLGDLGLAKSAGQTQSLTMTGHSMGTPHYISPEQVEAMRDVDLRADIYSLGCTLFHLLSGQAPYDGNSAVAIMMKHVTAPVPDLRGVWPECPDVLAGVVGKMMRKAPAERQQSYAEVTADLRGAYDVLSGASVPSILAMTQPSPAAKSPQKSSPAGEKKRGVPVAAWAGGAVACAAVGALWYFAPWKKADGNPGGTRSVASQASADKDGKEVAAAPSTTSLPATGWQPLVPDLGKRALRYVQTRPDGWVFLEEGKRLPAEVRQRDVALRTRLRARAGARMGTLIVRSTEASWGVVNEYALEVQNTDLGKAKLIMRAPGEDRKSVGNRTLGVFSLPKKLADGEEFELGLSAVGNEITAFFNGQPIGHAVDDTCQGSDVTVWGGADLKNVEWVALKNPALPATATKDVPFVNTLGMKFVPVPGTDILMCIHETRRKDYAAYAEAVPAVDGAWKNPVVNGKPLPQQDDHPVVMVSWEDATAFCSWLSKKEGRTYRLPTEYEWNLAVVTGLDDPKSISPADLAKKLEGQYPWGPLKPEEAGNYLGSADGFEGTAPVMSFQPNPLGIYDLGGNAWEWCSDWFDAGHKRRVLRGGGYLNYGPARKSSWRVAAEPDFRAPPNGDIDRRVPGFRIVALRTAGALPPTPSTDQSVSSRDIQSITATKDAPYVNTLGMKFAPVPIIGGPTGGQRVLFSVWDTRVQDYEVFAKETQHEWPKVSFPQDATHPAVMVSWEDAKAFCAWLTERDRQAGKLSAQEAYRLPTDYEWSCAVGIGDQEDPAKQPNDRNEKIDTYPWGAQWPPPAGAGNYADSTRHERYPSDNWIEGYTDGYVNTSPVGSFLANPFGLYDMGGNVCQWCEDWFDPSHTTRVLRGSTWGLATVNYLRSSRHDRSEPTHRQNDRGFRCVLEAAPPAAPATAALEPGAIKLWDSPGKIAGSPSARWEGGAMRLDGFSPKVEITGRDGIIRARIRRNADSGEIQLGLRVQGGHYYRLTLHFTNVELFAIAEGGPQRIAQWPLPRAFGPDEWPLLEFKAVGDELSARIDGQPLGTVHDSALPQAGSVTAFATRAGYFREVVYVPLDTPGTPTSIPAAATKDAPFVNTLGMKFVPVPGTKVLFSIWDTRVQDYKEYAGARKVDDSWTKQQKDGAPVGRELNDPVVGVSWEDAQGYCQWLTEKDVAEGKLTKGMKYRLPTDEEWSRAVGLSVEQGATPAERNRKNSVDFPWGAEFPPRAGVGNYADSVLHEKFPKDSWMEGYTDGYATTSPVGSFPANAYGLYDMSGNVWQWCEDWLEAAHQNRVLRGASWIDHDSSALLSSSRHGNTPKFSASFYGFRCVLEMSASPEAAAAAPGNGAWANAFDRVKLPDDILNNTRPDYTISRPGHWTLSGNTLQLTEGYATMIASHAALGANYDVSVLVTTQGGVSSFMLGLPVGDRQAAWVGMNGKYLTGFEQIGGRSCYEGPATSNVYPFQDKKPHLLEVAVRTWPDGRAALRARIDGQEAAHWTGQIREISMYGGWSQQPPTQLGIGGSLGSAGIITYSDARVRQAPPDPEPADTTSPVAATKDAPFVNTLGMKFVPVPGTKVLFSVWDTRFEDYAAFAEVNKVDGSWLTQQEDGTPVSRKPGYPVVGVNWDDAQAFCQWLTEKERAGGKLPPGARYRLPTDEEWSRAAGLDSEQGATPAEKSGKNTVNFPWGLGFPPKEKAGNYADAAWHEKYPDKKWIENYTDGYACTSPVGSFPANALGLYDMGGNVWQWCEERFEPNGTTRVLRGGAYNNELRENLWSSFRRNSPPTFRAPFAGFRCVLDVSVSK